MTNASDKPEPPLRVAILPVTPFQQNCSLIWCTKTMRARWLIRVAIWTC
jgi:hypothetical protein